MTEPKPKQLIRFLELLMDNAPDDYEPWLFRCEAGSKAPDLSYGSWKKDRARLTKQEAIKWMDSGGNVGIAGTPDDALVNVDIDDEDETTPDDLKQTLIARSRSRTGVHAWYFATGDRDIPNIPTDHAGEVRTDWQYVVAPGSYVDTDPSEVPPDERDMAGYYSVERENAVATLTFEELPEVFKRELRDEGGAQMEIDEMPGADRGSGEPVDEPDTPAVETREGGSGLFDITAEDVASRERGRVSKGERWTAIFHDSDTGKNMSLSSEGLLHCWRHEVAHNGLQALTVLSGYHGGCSDVGSAHERSRAGSSCIRGEGGAHIWHAWKYAKENGYLPDDDPVPYSALKYLCKSRELCAVSELPDTPDESIPAFAYDAAISSIRDHDGLDPGRLKTDEIEDDDDDSGRPDDTAAPDDSGPDLGLDADSVAIVARLDEDETIRDLTDREKAAAVWEIIVRSDDAHVRVRRDNGSIWACEGGIWERSEERALAHAARRALGSMNYGQNVLSELQAQARSDPRAELDAGKMGVDPGVVAVENGLLDLQAAAEGRGEDALRPLEPEDFALSRLPVEFNPDAEAARWREFVGQVVERDKIEAVQEFVGYCLHRGGMPHNKALLLVGSGANGKSTFLNTVRELLGSDHTTTKPVHKFDSDNHVADLYGSVANIDADMSEGSLSKEGIAAFKRLVGGDEIDARKLYEDAFSFSPAAKHLYACNQVPDVSSYVSDEDIAFWRRWIVVEFPNWYPEGSERRDPDLEDKLQTDDSLSGILNWAIAGWHKLMQQGKFSDIESYSETRHKWQQWGDSIEMFVAECAERDPDADRIRSDDVHSAYQKWCRMEGEDAVGYRNFIENFNKLTDDVGHGTHRFDGKALKGYNKLELIGIPEDGATVQEQADADADASPDQATLD